MLSCCNQFKWEHLPIDFSAAVIQICWVICLKFSGVGLWISECVKSKKENAIYVLTPMVWIFSTSCELVLIYSSIFLRTLNFCALKVTFKIKLIWFLFRYLYICAFFCVCVYLYEISILYRDIPTSRYFIHVWWNTWQVNEDILSYNKCACTG